MSTTANVDTLINAEMGAGHAQRRDNRIPYPRVLKIVDNGIAKAKAQLEADHKQAIAAATAKAKAETERPLLAQVATLQERIKEFDNLGQALIEAPERFLLALVELNPALSQYLSLNAPAPPTPGRTLFNRIAQHLESNHAGN